MQEQKEFMQSEYDIQIEELTSLRTEVTELKSKVFELQSTLEIRENKLKQLYMRIDERDDLYEAQLRTV